MTILIVLNVYLCSFVCYYIVCDKLTFILILSFIEITYLCYSVHRTFNIYANTMIFNKKNCTECSYLIMLKFFKYLKNFLNSVRLTSSE